MRCTYHELRNDSAYPALTARQLPTGVVDVAICFSTSLPVSVLGGANRRAEKKTSHITSWHLLRCRLAALAINYVCREKNGQMRLPVLVRVNSLLSEILSETKVRTRRSRMRREERDILPGYQSRNAHRDEGKDSN